VQHRPGASVVATAEAAGPRPLVVRFGALGDQVILFVLIEALRRRFGVPVDFLASGAWSKPLAEANPAIDTLHVVRSRRTPYLLSLQQQRLVRALRSRPPGPVWLCDADERGTALLRRAGVAEKWLLRAHRDCPRLPGEHNVERWLRFAQQSPPALPPMAAGDAAAIVRGLTCPPLRVLPAWRAEVEAWLRTLAIADRPLILVQVGNKRTMHPLASHRRASNSKYWPEERWAEVINRLQRRHPTAVVLLLGVPREARINDEIARLARSDRLLNVARQMTVPRLLGLQERALGMISVDTGPAHTAAALGCPVVVLFGLAEVEAYAPRSPSGAVEVLTGRDENGLSILAISVQDVEDAWERLPLRSPRAGEEDSVGRRG